MHRAQAVEAVAYWRDAATFAALHLKGMTHSLKKQYYAEIERSDRRAS